MGDWPDKQLPVWIIDKDATPVISIAAKKWYAGRSRPQYHDRRAMGRDGAKLAGGPVEYRAVLAYGQDPTGKPNRRRPWLGFGLGKADNLGCHGDRLYLGQARTSKDLAL